MSEAKGLLCNCQVNDLQVTLARSTRGVQRNLNLVSTGRCSSCRFPAVETGGLLSSVPPCGTAGESPTTRSITFHNITVLSRRVTGHVIDHVCRHDRATFIGTPRIRPALRDCGKTLPDSPPTMAIVSLSGR